MDFAQEDVLGGKLLQMGGLMLIAGATEVGKSYLVQQLAYEIAVGGKFLAWEVTRPFIVLMVQGELGPGPFQDRIKKFSNHYGYAPTLKTATHFSLRLEDEENWQHLLEGVQSSRAEVLVLDPMRPFHLGDENSSQDMERYFGQIKRLQTETGVAVVQTHHERKPTKGQEGDMSAIRGSALITDRPDTVLRLTRKGRPPTWKLEFEKIRNASSSEKPPDMDLKVASSGLFVEEDGALSPLDVYGSIGDRTTFGELADLLVFNCHTTESRAERMIRGMIAAGQLTEQVDPKDRRKRIIRRS